MSHIYREGPADHEWLDIAVGDYVLAINGEELRSGDNYWRTLTHGERVHPRAGGVDPPGARNARTSASPVGHVAHRHQVRGVGRHAAASLRGGDGGRIAYVHIRSMNQPSLERFRNEINQFWNAEGIVVDIRYNGGGNIDQELIDILERQPYQFWNNRWGAPTWGRRPRQAIAGPKVMLINWRSGSDSEVTPQAFRSWAGVASWATPRRRP
jgi:tricorn protease